MRYVSHNDRNDPNAVSSSAPYFSSIIKRSAYDYALFRVLLPGQSFLRLIRLLGVSHHNLNVYHGSLLLHKKRASTESIGKARLPSRPYDHKQRRTRYFQNGYVLVCTYHTCETSQVFNVLSRGLKQQWHGRLSMIPPPYLHIASSGLHEEHAENGRRETHSSQLTPATAPRSGQQHVYRW